MDVIGWAAIFLNGILLTVNIFLLRWSMRLGLSLKLNVAGIVAASLGMLLGAASVVIP